MIAIAIQRRVRFAGRCVIVIVIVRHVTSSVGRDSAMGSR